MKSYKWLCRALIAVVLFWVRTSLAAMTNAEMEQRLNQLMTIIQKQQEEIQKLKQELEQQKTITILEQKVNKKEIKEIVKTQMKKKKRNGRA